MSVATISGPSVCREYRNEIRQHRTIITAMKGSAKSAIHLSDPNHSVDELDEGMGHVSIGSGEESQ